MSDLRTTQGATWKNLPPSRSLSNEKRNTRSNGTGSAGQHDFVSDETVTPSLATMNTNALPSWLNAPVGVASPRIIQVRAPSLTVNGLKTPSFTTGVSLTMSGLIGAGPCQVPPAITHETLSCPEIGR